MALPIGQLGAAAIVAFHEGPILALESSCDETSAAVLVNREIRANVIASQIEMHQRWGGVVPEAAARQHVEAILPVISEALATANIERTDLRAIGVTNRPGLVGALSIGVTAAKALAFALKIPLIGIHHLEGHLCSVFGGDDDVPLPHLALIVSGGHTELVEVRDIGDYQIAGATRDDAAGEAFDKSARLLGLGYPGGYAIQQAALDGNPKRYPLPRGLRGDTVDFSFSGLKTAVRRLVETEGDRLHIADAAASIQEAIVSVLADRAIHATEVAGYKTLTLVGGVAANLALRQRLLDLASRRSIRLVVPPLSLCTDNAAMIGLAASIRLARGEVSDFNLESLPNAELGS